MIQRLSNAVLTVLFVLLVLGIVVGIPCWIFALVVDGHPVIAAVVAFVFAVGMFALIDDGQGQ